MNHKEKIVLIFLCLTFLAGAVISVIRYSLAQRHLQAITITTPTNKMSDDTLYNNIDSSYKNVLININTATTRELDALPGIGPVLAQRIIDYREKHGSFKKIVDLLNVSGIGPKKFSALKDKVTINQ